jgi:hypothetical protein
MRELLPHVFTLVGCTGLAPGQLRRLFSVALAVPRLIGVLPVRKYGALRCPDFPLHPLPDVATEQAAALNGKISQKINDQDFIAVFIEIDESNLKSHFILKFQKRTFTNC